jgi:hypothetical protein
MQITLDLPDDVCAKAEAIAKQQSRSVGSFVADLVRSFRTPKPAIPPGTDTWTLPVVACRPFTMEELQAALNEEHDTQ